MAGYDFSLTISNSYNGMLKDWLKKYRRIAKKYNLDISYRIKSSTKNKIELYVTVDGKLWAMQHLDRTLPELIVSYIQFSSFKANKPLFVFYQKNKEGVNGITNMIFSISSDLKGRPSGAVLPNSLSDKIDLRNPRKRDIKAIKSMIDTLDNRLLGRISNKQTIILIDQAMEEWLKSKLNLPKNNRENFPILLEKVLERGIVNKKEKYRLSRFHKSRNGVQHRGKKAYPKTIFSMFQYYVYFLSKYY